jgi:hypothetical protein
MLLHTNTFHSSLLTVCRASKLQQQQQQHSAPTLHPFPVPPAAATHDLVPNAAEVPHHDPPVGGAGGQNGLVLGAPPDLRPPANSSSETGRVGGGGGGAAAAAAQRGVDDTCPVSPADFTALVQTTHTQTLHIMRH